MGFKKFSTIYTNGCSHTAGGGLYDQRIKTLYNDLHGIKWESEREVTYPKRLSNHFNCKLVDDSTCGSGAPRLIRKTYEYITKYGIENAKKTLFILQINTSVGRLDYYCKKINDYVTNPTQGHINQDRMNEFNQLGGYYNKYLKYKQKYLETKRK